MDEQEKDTLKEAHKTFAKQFNGRVWSLLRQPVRTRLENEEMEFAAFASLYHWLYVGTPVNRQRGEWLIYRVYTFLGHADLALRHAERCLELTQENPDDMEDFDVAFAYEGMARALAMSGDKEHAREYFDMAKSAGESIKDEEDKEIFTADLTGGNWYGLI